MKATKEELYGFIGACIFCLLIFLVLFRVVIKTTIPAKEEGVLAIFEKDVNWSAGTFTPKPEEPPQGATPPQEATPQEETTPQEEVKPQEAVKKPQEVTKSPPVTEPKKAPVVQKQAQKKTLPSVITQDKENTAAIEAERKKQEEKKRLEVEATRKKQEEKNRLDAEAARKKQEENKRLEAERAQQAKAAEEQRKKEAINQQVTNAFGSGSGSGTGQQNQKKTEKPNFNVTQGGGSQGSGSGSGSGSSSSKGGGYGEFNLNGRTLGVGGLPRPTYFGQDEGRIVINITVDPKGNVIFAEIGRGTNIDNANSRNSALEAARKAKFNNIEGNNNQSGTITYKYSLK